MSEQTTESNESPGANPGSSEGGSFMGDQINQGGENNQPAPGSEPNNEPANKGEGDWKSQLPDDVRKSVEAFDSPETLAKGYKDLFSKLGESGENRVLLPGEDADPSEWGKVYDRLGRPENPDGYQLSELPEGMQRNEEAEKQFREWAHSAGLNNQQADALYQAYAKDQLERYNQQVESAQAERERVEQELSAEWGSEYDTKMKALNEFIKYYAGGDEELQQFIAEHGNNKSLVKLFSNLGESLLESAIEEGNTTGFGGDKASAKSELEQIMGDMSGPYWNKDHPQHKSQVERVAELNKILYG